MVINNVNPEPVPQNKETSQMIKNEIHDIVNQLSDTKLKGLAACARGLLKHQKLTGN